LQIEKERKLALPLITAILDLHVWRFDLPSYVDLEVVVGTPNQYMCLDSAAAEAVNLLPSPGQVAVGSLHGLFARHCKTKLGPKTLERWLRQPLLDVDAINTRLNVVESLVGNARLRSLLRDTGLKSVPDVLPVLHKFQKGTAGLAEIFKLYLFSRSIASVSGSYLSLRRPVALSELTSASASASASVLCSSQRF
jgi:DNA mismatch repair ATPase MutS